MSGDQPVHALRVYFCIGVALQLLSFLFADFVNGAAVWAGDKIPFSETEQRNKEENKPLACTGDDCHGVRDSAAGEVSALPVA